MNIQPRQTTRTRQLKSGFTLIELLIVISIIAILAGILFPVFARARENARRASCQSNLKQIGLGVLQYVQDYDEFMPPAVFTSIETGDSAPGYALSGARIGPYTRSDQILVCPSDPGPRFTVRSVSGTADVPCSYIVTEDQFTGKTGFRAAPALGGNTFAFTWGAFSYSFPVPLADFAAPAETIMVTEQDESRLGADRFINAFPAAPSLPNYSAYASSLVSNRHLQTINYLFADGHVKAFRRPDRLQFNVVSLDRSGANATLNGVSYYYFWRKGVTGKE